MPKDKNKDLVGYDQADYDNLSEIEHVLDTPGMYIDSIEQDKRLAWVMKKDKKNKDNWTVTKDKVTFPLGMERIFIEIIANACDAMNKSIKHKVLPGNIVINMTDNEITVKNTGIPIPVVIHKKSGKYVPELVFSTMRAGSNFGKKRHGGGSHGLGAKLCNIFSRRFEVTVLDAKNKKSYHQVWYDNMSQTDGPKIKKYKGDEQSVTVSYIADFKRFGYKHEVYPKEAVGIIRRLAADASFTCKSIVEFNREEMNYASIIDYSSLYTNVDVKNKFIYYEWPTKANDIVVDKKTGVQYSKSNLYVPNVELMVIDAPGNGFFVSMCNSIMNIEGGKHIDAVCTTIGNILNDAMSKKTDDANDKKKRKGNIAKSIRNHIQVIVNVRVVDPTWNGQTKTQLKSFKTKDGKRGEFKFNLGEDIIKKVQKWDLNKAINIAIKSDLILQGIREAKKMDKSKFKGEDAAWAGTAKSDQCTLIFFEGDSAMGYSQCIRTAHPNGTNQLGLFALKGKIANAIKKNSMDALMKVDLFKQIISILGLEDLDYTIESNRKKLRYGNILIMPDADIDGLHITILLISFFAYFFPTIIRANIIDFWKTKIVRVTKGKKEILFYSEFEYEEWKKETPDWQKWHAEYFKGLGSTNVEDAKKDFDNPFIVNFKCDRRAFAHIIMSMSKNYTDMRKDWIMTFDDTVSPQVLKNNVQLITNFINDEVRRYSKHTLVRHIAARDGFKDGSRKAIFAAIKKWNWYTNANKKNKLRVDVFSGYLISEAQYHHADPSKIVMGMAQTFVGSNNINLFVPDGQFGTRTRGGKDMAAPRYPFTYPSIMMKYLIRKEFAPILIHKYEDGQYVEPERYYPVLPLILINGMDGVASGWKSWIYQCHPLLIADWYIKRLSGTRYKKMEELMPWWRGFTGKSYIEKTSKKTSSKQNTIDLEANFDDVKTVLAKNTKAECAPREKYRVVTIGKFKKVNDNTVRVTELPIGMWTKKYKIDILRPAMKAGVIKKFKCDSDIEKVDITISGIDFGDEKIDAQNLGLVKTYSINDMYILSENNLPMRFNSAKEIAEDYYQWMLPFYQKLKEYMLNEIKIKIDDKTDRMKYISEVIEGNLVLFVVGSKKGRDENDVLKDIKKLKLNPDLYGKISDRDFSKNKILLLQKEIDKLTDEYNTLDNTPHSQMWIDHINDFIKAYIKEYGDDRP